MPILYPQQRFNPFLQQQPNFGNFGDSSPQFGMEEPNQSMLPPQRNQLEPYTEGPMMGGYRKFLEEGPPRREDHKPGKLDRIVGAIGGAAYGDPRVGQDFQNRGYNRALEDRDTRGKELSLGAELESRSSEEGYKRFLDQKRLDISQQNANSLSGNRTSLEQTRRRRQDLAESIADGRATDDEKHEYQMLQIKERGSNQLANTGAQGDEARRTEGVRQTGRMNLEGQRQSGREKLLQTRQSNPTWKIVPSKGGNYYAINPDDPTEVRDTGVTTGTLTEEDKAELGITESTSTTAVSKTDDSGNPSEITRKTTRTRPNAAPRTNKTLDRPKQMTSPDGKTYDTSTWSDADIAKAREAKFR